MNEDLSTDKCAPPVSRSRQYGLRTLFALLLAAALPVWWLRAVLDELAVEHDAVVKLRAAGALVAVEPARPLWFWKHLPKSIAPHSEHAVRFEASDYQGPIDAREMLRIGRLSCLKELILRNLPLEDDDLAGCGALTELEDLKIKNCRRLTSAAIHYFRNARQLRHLDLTATPIDDAALETVATFEQLQDLQLPYTNTTDARMEKIGRLKRLRRLSLPRGVTSSGLRHIGRLESLGGLSVYLHKGDDVNALRYISMLPGLRSLQFHGALSDEGAKAISRSETLGRLFINGDGFTQSRSAQTWTNSPWSEAEDDWVYTHGLPTRFDSTTVVRRSSRRTQQAAPAESTGNPTRKQSGRPPTLFVEEFDHAKKDQTTSSGTLSVPSGAGGAGSRAPPYP